MERLRRPYFSIGTPLTIVPVAIAKGLRCHFFRNAMPGRDLRLALKEQSGSQRDLACFFVEVNLGPYVSGRHFMQFGGGPAELQICGYRGPGLTPATCNLHPR